MNAYPKAMRLERWPRSTAILVGSAALFVLDPTVLSRLDPFAIALRVAGAFLLTWAVSTANYIINEIADAPFDVHHPTKRTRPLASGAVRKGPLLGWAAVLGGASLALAQLLYSRIFFLALLALLLAGFAYNVKPVRTKDIPFLDSISESVNNPIRFLIGWYALAAPAFPPWSLLVCWWAFGNFLMVAKRLSEFRFLGEKAGDYRASLRRYSRETLLLGMGASAAVLFAAYFAFAAANGLRGFFWLSPFLAFYLFLFFRKTLAEKEVMEEPEKLLARPKYAVYTAALVLLFAAAFLLGRHGH
jgi:decaprenyl-phosphate phosphoribosyltransferase